MSDELKELIKQSEVDVDDVNRIWIGKIFKKTLDGLGKIEENKVVSGVGILPSTENEPFMVIVAIGTGPCSLLMGVLEGAGETKEEYTSNVEDKITLN